jgi:transcriptional regulator with XRE-family HTH domain
VDFLKGEKDHGLSHDAFVAVPDNADMPKERSENHLKAWRKFRRMTQQELADAIEPTTTKQVIQAIETGARGLSDKWLRRLAPALGTTPGFLLDHAPEELPTEFLDVVERIPADQRDQALAVLKTFTKAG